MVYHNVGDERMSWWFITMLVVSECIGGWCCVRVTFYVCGYFEGFVVVVIVVTGVDWSHCIQ